MADTKSPVLKKTVPQLRTELEKLGLSPAGKKAELIERLREHESKDSEQEAAGKEETPEKETVDFMNMVQQNLGKAMKVDREVNNEEAGEGDIVDDIEDDMPAEQTNPDTTQGSSEMDPLSGFQVVDDAADEIKSESGGKTRPRAGPASSKKPKAGVAKKAGAAGTPDKKVNGNNGKPTEKKNTASPQGGGDTIDLTVADQDDELLKEDEKGDEHEEELKSVFATNLPSCYVVTRDIFADNFNNILCIKPNIDESFSKDMMTNPVVLDLLEKCKKFIFFMDKTSKKSEDLFSGGLCLKFSQKSDADKARRRILKEFGKKVVCTKTMQPKIQRSSETMFNNMKYKRPGTRDFTLPEDVLLVKNLPLEVTEERLLKEFPAAKKVVIQTDQREAMPTGTALLLLKSGQLNKVVKEKHSLDGKELGLFKYTEAYVKNTESSNRNVEGIILSQQQRKRLEKLVSNGPQLRWELKSLKGCTQESLKFVDKSVDFWRSILKKDEGVNLNKGGKKAQKADKKRNEKGRDRKRPGAARRLSPPAPRNRKGSIGDRRADIKGKDRKDTKAGRDARAGGRGKLFDNVAATAAPSDLSWPEKMMLSAATKASMGGTTSKPPSLLNMNIPAPTNDDIVLLEAQKSAIMQMQGVEPNIQMQAAAQHMLDMQPQLALASGSQPIGGPPPRTAGKARLNPGPGLLGAPPLDVGAPQPAREANKRPMRGNEYVPEKRSRFDPPKPAAGLQEDDKEMSVQEAFDILSNFNKMVESGEVAPAEVPNMLGQQAPMEFKVPAPVGDDWQRGGFQPAKPQSDQMAPPLSIPSLLSPRDLAARDENRERGGGRSRFDDRNREEKEPSHFQGGNRDDRAGDRDRSGDRANQDRGRGNKNRDNQQGKAGRNPSAGRGSRNEKPSRFDNRDNDNKFGRAAQGNREQSPKGRRDRDSVGQRGKESRFDSGAQQGSRFDNASQRDRDTRFDSGQQQRDSRFNTGQQRESRFDSGQQRESRFDSGQQQRDTRYDSGQVQRDSRFDSGVQQRDSTFDNVQTQGRASRFDGGGSLLGDPPMTSQHQTRTTPLQTFSQDRAMGYANEPRSLLSAPQDRQPLLGGKPQSLLGERPSARERQLESRHPEQGRQYIDRAPAEREPAYQRETQSLKREQPQYYTDRSPQKRTLLGEYNDESYAADPYDNNDRRVVVEEQEGWILPRATQNRAPLLRDTEKRRDQIGNRGGGLLSRPDEQHEHIRYAPIEEDSGRYPATQERGRYMPSQEERYPAQERRQGMAAPPRPPQGLLGEESRRRGGLLAPPTDMYDPFYGQEHKY